ncbi:MAG TPA: hypothetical protein VK335_02580 [Bryobacteraceae bacterium]|nr:hypothetical protein [Bryobacteraceae bacterium]
MNRNRSQRGGVLAGVLAAFLILAALAVVGVFMAGIYVADNIHVEKTRTAKGETVQVDTPIGSLRVQEDKKLDPKLIGVPVYPNAVRNDNNHAASVDFSFDSGHKAFTVIAADYTTDDSIEKVKEFYHHELPHWMITQRFNGSVHMEYTEDGYKRIIAITEKHGQTHIALASVGEPASN